MNRGFSRNLHNFHHVKKRGPRRMVTVVSWCVALICLQGLVESTHVIDFAPIIVAQNSLTKFLKRVDSQSFFDISNVFPIGGESGIRVKVT
jgi:hypothetical protein